MATVYLDFETFWSDEYSLKKMTPAEYVLDPRFETVGCAVAIDDEPFRFLDHDEFISFLATLDHSRTTYAAFNSLFDMTILAWRYGIKPGLMLDGMSMARAIIGHAVRSLSLGSVAQYLGLPLTKGNFVYNVKGMSAAAIRANGMWDDYARYSCTDGDLLRFIVKQLLPRFPRDEIIVNDMVIRMVTEPSFVADVNELYAHQAQIVADKAALLARVGVEKKELMSNLRFCELLLEQGVEPPKKISKTTGQEVFAFAKTDQEFIDLEDHPNPQVQALVAARMGFKSTLEETRTQRFINIAELNWPGEGQTRKFPIPLRYSGAHTHRFSGDWSLNAQNLRRGGNLRKALKAPPGKVVVSADASQIEARINAWMSGCTLLVNGFAAGADIYSEFATLIFGYPVSKKTHPLERFIGKTAILGLGYGMGWERFKEQVRIQSREMLGQEIILDDADAQRIVRLYRATYPEIANMWSTLEGLIPRLANANSMHMVGPMTFFNQQILGPAGLSLHYKNLKFENGRWWYEYGKRTASLYGPKLLENFCQHLARVCTISAAVRMRRRFPKLNLAHQVHDELIYVVPERAADLLKVALLEEMTRRPEWAPDLPLAAEAAIGPSYGECK